MIYQLLSRKKPSHLPPAKVGMLIVIVAAFAVLADPFVTPELIKANVEFWKKIYTEASLEEGYLHDSEFPLVIYDKIRIGERSGRTRSNFIKAQKSKVETLLSGINSRSESAWTEEQKNIVAQFEKYTSRDALKDAHTRIRFQQGQRERFLEGLHRSGAYIDTIRSILTQHGVPLRLQYLPHVESSFNPYAYSKVGAAGLWQFMQGTGREYGLKVGYNVDERRDPILATEAAAKLLAYNYSQLRAWPLAITAYNHGLYGMKRAVSSTGSRDIAVIIERHSSRSFKFASKNFYSCFIAASEIAADPSKYFSSVTYAPKYQCTDVTLMHYMKPSVVAKYLNISEMELAGLNPALRPVVFKQQQLIPKGMVIHLPHTVSGSSAIATLALVPDSLKLDKPPQPTYYRVRRGDNLYGIARKMGVSARDLAANNGITRMNRIYAGQVLRLPGAEKVHVAVKVPTPVEKLDTVASVGKKPTPIVAAAKVDTPIVAAARVDTPHVAVDDSLADIVMLTADTMPHDGTAQNWRARMLFDANIYDTDVRISSTLAKSASIRVSVNETIGHYADWLGIPTWRIRQLNRMGNRSTIHEGQRLSIPADEEMIELFTQRRLEYHMGLEEDFYSQYKVTDVRLRTIQRGETLWDISKDEGFLPLWLMKKHNMHVDLARLGAGTKIYVPVVEELTEEDRAVKDQEWGGEYPYYLDSAPPSTKPFMPVP